MATAPLGWRIRRSFWTRWQTLRFGLNKPLEYGPPDPDRTSIGTRPLGEIQDGIPLRSVVAFDRLPVDESGLGMRALVGLGLFLNKVVPPMKTGLPEIDDEIGEAVEEAVPRRYRKSFRAPAMPDVYAGSGTPDLAELAVRSPYSVFLDHGDGDRLQWDFRMLGDFEHHDGAVFAQPAGAVRGGRYEWRTRGYSDRERGVRFGSTRRSRVVGVVATGGVRSIDAHGAHPALQLRPPRRRRPLGRRHPQRPTTGPSAVHAHVAAHLPQPLHELRNRPHAAVTRWRLRQHLQLHPRRADGVLRRDVRALRRADHRPRRRLGPGAVSMAHAKFEHPSHDNLRELFGGDARPCAALHRGLLRTSDEALRDDAAVVAWIEALDDADPERHRSTRSVAGLLASGLARSSPRVTSTRATWSTTWPAPRCGTTSCGPIGTRRGSTPTVGRIPVDVYQRMINNNFALQIKRAPDAGRLRAASHSTPQAGNCSPGSTPTAQRSRIGTTSTPAGPWRMEPEESRDQHERHDRADEGSHEGARR